MRKYIINSIFGIITIMLALTSCYEQEVSPVADPGVYPVATFTVTGDNGGAPVEGDTIVCNVTLDKPFDADLTFDITIIDGDADEDDFTVLNNTLEAYTTSTDILIILNDDGFPELAENLHVEVGVTDIGHKYRLNPSTVNKVIDVNIVNVNDPEKLTIAFGWEDPDHEMDFDIFAISETNGDWGLAGTSANPEIMKDIWAVDPDGTYYFTVDPYDVNKSTVNYTISVGHPNQSVEVFTGVFDYDNRDTEYTIDYFAYWGVDTYRLMTIVNNGGTFTLTHLN